MGGGGGGGRGVINKVVSPGSALSKPQSVLKGKGIPEPEAVQNRDVVHVQSEGIPWMWNWGV